MPNANSPSRRLKVHEQTGHQHQPELQNVNAGPRGGLQMTDTNPCEWSPVIMENTGRLNVHISISFKHTHSSEVIYASLGSIELCTMLVH